MPSHWPAVTFEEYRVPPSGRTYQVVAQSGRQAQLKRKAQKAFTHMQIFIRSNRQKITSSRASIARRDHGIAAGTVSHPAAAVPFSFCFYGSNAPIVGAEGRVVQFVYERGGPKPPSNVTTTWASYEKAGPLLVSTDHRGTADGKPARIFFTNVAYKLAGSDKWMDATPAK